MAMVPLGALLNPFIPEYKLIYDAVSVKPPKQIALAQNAFVKSLVDGGIWAKLTHMIPYAWGMPNANDALIWANDITKSAILAGSVVPTYEAGKGFTGTGTGYINTKFNPSGSTKFTQNDCAYGWYYTNNKATAASKSSGAYTSSGVLMSPENITGVCYHALNCAAQNSPVVGSNYLFIVSRSGSTGYNFHQNKLTLVAKTVNSVALNNLEFYSLGFNNNGTVNELGTDTIGLEFGCSSLTQPDVDLINNSWAILMQDIQPDILFQDLADGLVIDTNKWTVANSDPTKIEIEQNNAIKLHALPVTGVADYITNSIKSKISATHGVFSFSAVVTKKISAAAYFQFGLFANAANRIEFYTDTASGNLDFRIVYGYATVYRVANVCETFGEFKIVVDQYHNISAYIWINDAWVQIGATYNQAMGTKSVYAGTRGYNGAMLSLKDIYITNKDRTTILPISENVIALDVRTFGAIADESTDSVSAINTALQAGDVILQHGNFIIESSILIPSNRTLYIKNASVKLADNSFDNVFRNSDPLNGNTNVNVIGLGNAVIDGNAAGNDSVDYTVFGGISMAAENLYKGNTFFVGNTNTFEIKGLIVVDKPAYLCAIQRSMNGSIHDIHLSFKTVTQNQDGIAIYAGTHDIEIYNMRGNIGDDFVSINLATTIPGLWYKYSGSFYLGDVYNINFHDFKIYDSIYHGVIFITGDGNKIHDISYNNVTAYKVSFLTYFGLGGYNTVDPAESDMMDIIMDNITVLNQSNTDGVIHFNKNCKDIAITNYVNSTGKPNYVKNSGTQTNVSINGTII